MLELHKVYYLDLIHPFYSNMKNTGMVNTAVVESYVKGREFALTQTLPWPIHI